VDVFCGRVDVFCGPVDVPVDVWMCSVDVWMCSVDVWVCSVDVWMCSVDVCLYSVDVWMCGSARLSFVWRTAYFARVTPRGSVFEVVLHFCIRVCVYSSLRLVHRRSPVPRVRIRWPRVAALYWFAVPVRLSVCRGAQ